MRVSGPPSRALHGPPPLRWPDAWVTDIVIITTASIRRRMSRGPRSKLRAAARMTVHFCAKIDFRDNYRRRDLEPLLAEIDGLIAQGVRYLYFIDEIFLPQRALLGRSRRADIVFGVQTRIDLWKPEMIDTARRAGCVSIEAGVESLTEEGRAGWTRSAACAPRN